MLTVLFVFCFYVSNVNTPLFVPLIPDTAVPIPKYAVPPSMAMGEFSTPTACEAAGQAFVAEMKLKAAPNVLVAGYKCMKKA